MRDPLPEVRIRFRDCEWHNTWAATALQCANEFRETWSDRKHGNPVVYSNPNEERAIAVWWSFSRFITAEVRRMEATDGE